MAHGPDDAAFLALVEHIYEAAADPRLWLDFTRSLHQHFPYASISTLLVDLDGRLSPFGINTGLPDEFVQSYMQHYHKFNSYAPVLGSASSGTIVSCAETLPREWLKKQIYFNEWLRPAGNFTSGACLIVEKSEQQSMQVSIDIPEQHDHEESTAGRLLARLYPHLARAFKLNQLLRGEAAHLATIDGLIQNINAAAFVLDVYGNPTHLNGAAEALLREGRVRTGHNGQLRLPRATDQEKLDHAVATSAGTSLEAGLPFRSRGSDGTEMFVTVLPLRPRGQGYGLGDARTLVIIKPHDAESPLSIEVLRAIHGLTLREAQVASLVASGAQLEQIADVLGVSAVTARNQLASAMGKLGTSRQVELIAMLSKIRTTFGPG